MFFSDRLEGVEGGGDDLVHVVVAVGGEATEKEGVWLGGGELSVFLITFASVRRGDGIVGFTATLVVLGVFFDDGGLWMFLAGDVFDFDDARVVVIVWVVDLDGGLVEFGVVSFRGELERAVGEIAVGIIEVLIDHACVD